MSNDFVNLTTETLKKSIYAALYEVKKAHPGIEAKRQWLSERLKEGHVLES